MRVSSRMLWIICILVFTWHFTACGDENTNSNTSTSINDTGIIEDVSPDTTVEPDVVEDARPDVEPDVVDTRPTVSARATPSMGRAPLVVEFEAVIEGGDEVVEMEWDFDDGESSIEQNPTYTYTTPGNYTVTCTITDANGDIDSGEVEVVVAVDGMPEVSIEANPIDGVAPLEVAFTSGVVGGDEPLRYLWDFGGVGSSTEANPSFTFNDSGPYAITLIVTDADGDSDNDVVDIVVGDAGSCEWPLEGVLGNNIGNLGTRTSQTHSINDTCSTRDADPGDGPEAVWSYTPERDSEVCVSTVGSSYDTVLYVRETSCDEPDAEIVCNDNFSSALQSQVSFSARMGTEYFIFVDAHNSLNDGGDYRLRINPGPCPRVCPERVWPGNFTGDVQQLEGYTSVNGSVTIENQPGLTNLDSLSCLSSISSYLEISDNGGLENVDGLASLSSVGQSLFIWGNDGLRNVDGLSSLSALDGKLEIRDNDVLENVDGLASLSSLNNDLGIHDNDELENVDGLVSLSSISGFLSISDNDGLENVDGLSSLSSVGISLAIRSNKVLENVDGLASLSFVGRDVNIWRNDGLRNVDGLSSLSSIGQDLRIDGNGVLSHVNGLASLSSIGQDLFIRGNDRLSNVDGLASLSSVGRTLTVIDNDLLRSVDGFASLSYIGGGLGIDFNSVLSHVNGLASLSYLGDILTITRNPQMCQESVDTLIAQLNMRMEPDPSIGGISGNDGMCVE